MKNKLGYELNYARTKTVSVVAEQVAPSVWSATAHDLATHRMGHGIASNERMAEALARIALCHRRIGEK